MSALVPVMVVVGIGGGLVFGPAGTAAVNAVGAQRRRSRGRPLLHVSSRTWGDRHCLRNGHDVRHGDPERSKTVASAANVSLPASGDLRVLAAGTLEDPAVKAITGRFSGNEAEADQRHAVRESFCHGSSRSLLVRPRRCHCRPCRLNQSWMRANCRTDAPEEEAAEI